ncbi:sigma factor-like helix-turn-helix DNA-binding protein [Romboutsia lituseburensis]|uniref:sigma factor-like helix-turn-helix DNA-binding protein n=1 Tax=Romboutsia lituseburensis TaxID=1537 RepID=UPI0022EB8DFA|nr:sigma factor-like helix-turn-helix DNA-binding protein [Romboutsia lituseburensis]
MSNEDVKNIVKEVVKEIKEEEEKKKKQGVLHNTRLLMRNYNDLKKHYDKAKSDIKDIDDKDINIKDIDEDELYILSIKRSRIKTLIMISHIDFALGALRDKQKQLGTIEKFTALKLYYLDNKTYEEIAEKLNCSVISSRRWVKDMIKEMSVFLFGIDALKI